MVLRPALVRLPVHAERTVVEDLQAIHADVSLARARIACEDRGQGDIAATVGRPALERRQAGERWVRRLDELLTGRGCDAPRTGFHEIEERAELAQALGEGTRELQVEKFRDALAELVEVAHAERGRHAVLRAERVDEHGHVEAVDALEEQRHVAIARAFGDAVGDLGDLQIPRDRGGHPPEPPVPLEMVDELAEVGEAHSWLKTETSQPAITGKARLGTTRATTKRQPMSGASHAMIRCRPKSDQAVM